MKFVSYPGGTQANGSAQSETGKLAEIVPFPAAALASISEVIAALMDSLDMAANEPAGHTLRCCILGMNLGRRLGLLTPQCTDLYYALLLNGLGTARERTSTCEWMGMGETLCRHALRGFDWTRLEWSRVRFLLDYAFEDQSPLRRMLGVAGLLPRRVLAPALMTRRSFAGARLARKLGLPSGTAEAMYAMDERWNGLGSPKGLAGDAIPLIAHICCVAQDLAAFGELVGRQEAVDLLEQRSGNWYDPGVVAATITMHESGALWAGVDDVDPLATVLSLDSDPWPCDDDSIEEICSSVADVIDSRSRYTGLHSKGVARMATDLGKAMELSDREMRTLRCAALLHDIGKLHVPSEVLDKEGPLSEAQWSNVRQTPAQSYEILRKIRSFEPIAEIARSHHERLDGTGYPDGLQDSQISKLARILAMAEAYDALSSPRPYREDYSETEVLALLQSDIPHALDAATFEALKLVLAAKDGPAS